MRRSRSNRWAYLSRPDHNPPTDACPECTVPSRVHSLGGRLVPDPTAPNGIGWTEHRYMCEHRHEWVVREPAPAG